MEVRAVAAAGADARDMQRRNRLQAESKLSLDARAFS